MSNAIDQFFTQGIQSVQSYFPTVVKENDVANGVAWGLIIFAVNAVAVKAFHSVGLTQKQTQTLSFSPFPSNFTYNQKKFMVNWMFFMQALINPIGEELLFRGILDYGATNYFPNIPSIRYIVVPILFGAQHFLNNVNIGRFAVTSLFGAFALSLKKETNSLLVPTIAHIVNNLPVAYYTRKQLLSAYKIA